MVELGQPVLVVFAIPLEGYGDRILRVNVEHGDGAVLGEWADELVAVASEQGLPFWGAIGTSYRGWVKVRNGEVSEGISLLRNGTAAFRGTGAELFAPYRPERFGGQSPATS